MGDGEGLVSLTGVGGGRHNHIRTLKNVQKVNGRESEYMQSRSLPVTAVKLEKGFWAEKQRLVRETVLPYQYSILNDQLPGVEKSHALENLRLAAKAQAGEPLDEEFYGMVFQDSDVAKWMEAAAFSLAAERDPELEQRLDQVVELLERAQFPDGYLNSYFTVKRPGQRWTNLQEAHELYCAGHLMEAACAYHEATGKDRFLHIMERCADHIYQEFMQKNTRGYSGHPEIELALMKLYRASGNEKYRELAQHFVDVRGQEPHYFVEERKNRDWYVWQPNDVALDKDYTQSARPVREQRDAVGHSVRAVYLYTGMADLARETGDPGLKEACERLWESIVQRRMYVTGGIGSTVLGEAFTVDYDLPNDTVYAETCASIGLIFFARRMLELEPKGEYADVMERALYNTTLAGMALDGRRFFYVNPLESAPGIAGEAATQRHALPQRPQWYACACCPPNVARLLASIGSYAFSAGENTLFLHTYLDGRLESPFGWAMRCETGYPHDGRVSCTFLDPAETTVALHIPAWSRRTVLLHNGKEVDLSGVVREGYAYISGTFAPGDKLELVLDMEPRKVYASQRVPADSGRAAVQRGPLVYCAEGADNGGEVFSLSLDREGGLRELAFDPMLLGGVAPVVAQGWRTEAIKELYTSCRPERVPAEVRLIPYYAWANRGLNQMRVWLPEN